MLKIELNESENQALEKRLKKAKKQSALIYMDLKIIEFSNQGKSISKIGELLGLHYNSTLAIFKKGRKTLRDKDKGLAPLIQEFWPK